MKIQNIPIDKIIPYTQNPRKNDDAVNIVKKSLKEFGFQQPLVLDKSHEIVVGHTRYSAAKKLGLSEIPCIVADYLTEDQIKAYRIMDNKSAEYSKWNTDLLTKEIIDLLESDYDISLTGFTQNELKDMDINIDLDDLASQGLSDEDDIPEINQEYISKLGDVWIMGEHRLMCGDSTDKKTVETLMNGKRADMVFTDPPYNVAVEQSAGTIMNDDMSAEDFKEFLHETYKRYYENMKLGAVIYVAHSEAERASFTKEFTDAGFKLAQNLIWNKQHAVISRQDYNWKHEPILYGWKEGAGHYYCQDFTQTTVIENKPDYNRMEKNELIEVIKKMTENFTATVIDFDKPNKSELHPTMKPVGLVQRLIQNSSKQDWLVLDLFGGAGSTLIASVKAKRKCYMMELDPRFSDVIVKRWQKYTGKEAVHESTNKKFNDFKID
jgi:site-specific DNA-methyltransferase (adenine-specific)